MLVQKELQIAGDHEEMKQALMDHPQIPDARAGDGVEHFESHAQFPARPPGAGLQFEAKRILHGRGNPGDELHPAARAEARGLGTHVGVHRADPFDGWILGQLRRRQQRRRQDSEELPPRDHGAGWNGQTTAVETPPSTAITWPVT